METKGKINREQILSIADGLFYARGYSDTSYADLAEASRIPKGNFYYYYKTKDDLLRDVLERRLNGARQQLAGWEREARTPKGRLKLFANMLRENAETLSRYGCPMGTMVMELGKDRLELKKNAQALFEYYIDWFTKQFSDQFSLQRAQGHAKHLIAMAQGAAMLGHIYGDKDLIIKETRQIDKWLEDLFT
jgi:AcrR family transcriptional regulator